MMGLTVMRARTKISVLRLFGATLERTVCGSRHRFPIWSSQAKQWRSREERSLIMIRRPRGTIVTTKMVILTPTTAILLVNVIADIKIMNVTVCMWYSDVSNVLRCFPLLVLFYSFLSLYKYLLSALRYSGSSCIQWKEKPFARTLQLVQIIFWSSTTFDSYISGKTDAATRGWMNFNSCCIYCHHIFQSKLKLILFFWKKHTKNEKVKLCEDGQPLLDLVGWWRW